MPPCGSSPRRSACARSTRMRRCGSCTARAPITRRLFSPRPTSRRSITSPSRCRTSTPSCAASGRMKDNGYPVEWGPGRHGPGDNVFAYFCGPDEVPIEYTSEVLQIDDGYVPRGGDYWKFPPDGRTIGASRSRARPAITVCSGCLDLPRTAIASVQAEQALHLTRYRSPPRIRFRAGKRCCLGTKYRSPRQLQKTSAPAAGMLGCREIKDVTGRVCPCEASSCSVRSLRQLLRSQAWHRRRSIRQSRSG